MSPMPELVPHFELGRSADGSWKWASAIQVGENRIRLHRHGQLDATEAQFMEGLLADLLTVVDPDLEA